MKPYDAYWLAVDYPLEFKGNKDYYESILSKDCHYSYLYAKFVLNGRFKLGERRLKRSRTINEIWYFSEVLNQRVENKEYTFLNDSKHMKPYYNSIKTKDKTPLAYKFI